MHGRGGALRESGQVEFGADGPTGPFQRIGVPDNPGVSQDDVEAYLGGVLDEALDILCGAEAGCLRGLHLQVEREQSAGSGHPQGLPEVRDEQVWHDRGEPGPGPEDDPVRGPDRGDGLRVCRRCVRKQAHLDDASAGRGDLGLPLDRVNPLGGGIALGHPVGCSGARIVVTMMHAMRREGVRYGMATIGAGGGIGVAAVLELCD